MKKYIPILLVALSFIVYLSLTIPFASIVEFDPDEGRNLAKADLIVKGFSLYSQIWSDQPPLFTWILGFTFYQIGFSVIAARWIMIFFSTVLVTTSFSIIRSRLGLLPAYLSVIILILSADFAKLSCSIMIGMVSISLLVVALKILDLAEFANNKISTELLLAISGACFALSVSTKLISLPWALMFVFDIYFNRNFICKIRSLALWAMGFAVTILTILSFLDVSAFEQLFLPHWLSYKRGNQDNWSDILGFVMRDSGFWVLAILSPLAKPFSSQKGVTLFSCWLLLSLLLILKSQPLQYHYYPYTAVGISWLAAYSIKYSFIQLQDFYFKNSRIPIPRNSLIFACTVIISLSLGIANGVYRSLHFSGNIIFPQQEIDLVIKSLKQNATANPWVITDSPIFALLSNLSVPPECAVISRKRLLVDYNEEKLHGSFLEKLIEKYGSAQILIARSSYDDSFAAILRNEYVEVENLRIKEGLNFRHFIRSSYN